MDTQFVSVVEMNGRVQRVAAETRRLYLVSLNAMFMAKRSGGSAAAFQKVTAELRHFSERMQRQMELLREYIYALVRQVSELRRLSRQLRLLERAEALAREAGYTGRVRHATGGVREMQEGIAATHALFARAVAEASRLCLAGENLSVLAKMEAAAGGGESLLRLMRVAEELAEVVANIRLLLQALEGVSERITEMTA